MTTKSKANPVAGEQPSLIILSVDYETKLILPIVDGLELIRIWSTATEMKEAYKKPILFTNVDKEFKLRFISENQYKQMKIAAMLDPTEDDG